MKIIKILNALFLSIVLLTVLFGCHREKIETRFYPRLRTLKVTDISPEGAIFWGEVISEGDLPVLEYGFVWSVDNFPILKGSEAIVVKERFSSGEFSCRIDYGLLRDTSYYMRSFVKTEELVVYGDVISFVSHGTKLPVINEVKPSSGF